MKTIQHITRQGHSRNGFSMHVARHGLRKQNDPTTSAISYDAHSEVMPVEVLQDIDPPP